MLTESHHSLRSMAKSVQSSPHFDGYSVQSVYDRSDKSKRSTRSSPHSNTSIHPSSHSTFSVKSSTRGALHHKPNKPRAKLNEKVYWDGCGESFLSFRQALKGHFLQVGAGYLLDNHFLYHYKQNPSACQMEETYHHTGDIWLYHK